MTDRFNIPRTSLQLRSANAMARRFADDACREKHGHLTRASGYGLWFVEALADAGLPKHHPLKTDLAGTIAAVIDALNEAHGFIVNEADGEGIAPESFPLDIAELEAMHRATGGK